MNEKISTATAEERAGGDYDFRESHFERLHTALHQFYDAEIKFKNGNIVGAVMVFQDGLGNVEAVLEELADGEVDDRDE